MNRRGFLKSIGRVVGGLMVVPSVVNATKEKPVDFRSPLSRLRKLKISWPLGPPISIKWLSWTPLSEKCKSDMAEQEIRLALKECSILPFIGSLSAVAKDGTPESKLMDERYIKRGIRLEFKNPNFEDVPENREWLDKVEEIVNTKFVANRPYVMEWGTNKRYYLDEKVRS